MTSTSLPPNFFESVRTNHRRSMVLLVGTFVILYAFVNLIAGVFGGYSRIASCNAGDDPASCGDQWYWNPWTLVITGVLIALYLVVAYFSSARAALAITHARPAEGPEYNALRNLVEGVSIAAGVPMPKVYVIDDPAPNAFATGLRPEKAAVAVTTGLMERMSRQELEGVIAHEVGHIRNRDTSYMTLVVMTVGAVMVISTLFVRIGFYAMYFMGSSGRRRKDGNAAALIGLALLAIGLIGFVIAIPFAMLLKAALSRRREVMADATAVELTRNPTGIRSALEKLEADSAVVSTVSTSTAHLWIESPLERHRGTGFLGSVGRLFNSHPPLASRIETLRAYEGLDPAGRGPNDPTPFASSAGMTAGGGSTPPWPPPRAR